MALRTGKCHLSFMDLWRSFQKFPAVYDCIISNWPDTLSAVNLLSNQNSLPQQFMHLPLASCHWFSASTGKEQTLWSTMFVGETLMKGESDCCSIPETILWPKFDSKMENTVGKFWLENLCRNVSSSDSFAGGFSSDYVNQDTVIQTQTVRLAVTNLVPRLVRESRENIFRVAMPMLR